MTALAELQRDFIDHVLDDDQPLDDGWTERHQAGLAIYRGGYRARLVETIGETYERTRNLAGEEAFRQAAINHVIANPPCGWAMEEVATGFDRTLAELYPDRPDLAELAFIEAAMQTASHAADAMPLDAAGFAEATAGFGDGDWANLQIDFLPGTVLGTVTHDFVSVWHSLGSDELERSQPTLLPEPRDVVIWREDEQPVFITVPKDEGSVLASLQAGEAFGEICARLAAGPDGEQAVLEAGQMLGRWIELGLVASASA